MKNIALLLKKEGKTSTKLHGDVAHHANSNSRLNLAKLEVNELSSKQLNQLKAMRFKGPGVQSAVDSAIAGITSKQASTSGTPGRSRERHMR